MPEATGRKQAPPTPWRNLKAISADIVGARPQARELAVKRAREKIKTFLRPKVSLRFPARGMVIVKAMKKIEIVHADQRTLACNSRVKLGKATETTVASMAFMKMLSPAVKNIR
jgi:hypothetical protein